MFINIQLSLFPFVKRKCNLFISNHDNVTKILDIIEDVEKSSKSKCQDKLKDITSKRPSAMKQKLSQHKRNTQSSICQSHQQSPSNYW